MAFTQSEVKRGVIGDLRYEIGTVSNTGTSGTIIPGDIKKIRHVTFSNQSSSTGIYHTISGTTITVTTASGDDFTYEILGDQ